MLRGRLAVALLLPLLSGAVAPHADLSHVTPNDNLRPAGSLRSGVLTVNLEVRRGVWHPESLTGDSVIAPVFAETGMPGAVPGPLIRVPTGTTIAATVHNALPDSTITLYGLYTRPTEKDDSVRIQPGETKSFRFAAGAPGTYLYWANAGVDTTEEREQLAGALVVDSAGARSDDRIFVINIWGWAKDSATYLNTLTINGRSWPYDERISTSVGDTLRWRWVNASGRVHPMHLHGFYFRLDSRGGVARDTLLAPDDRKLLVTQLMQPRSTMRLTWSPDRPGNWLFHCHIGFHVVPDAQLHPPPEHDMAQMSHDPTVHMAGLVMGISVKTPRGWREPPRDNPKSLRLYVQEGRKRFTAPRTLGFVLETGDRPPAADSTETPGSLLVLHQGQPTDITVINRLKEPAAIHWHGIELKSYSDGVPGWSGAASQMAPSIEPGDSFVAHLTLPRAGTFIYHTHMNDIEQITSGLYGAIVVLPPGQSFDPERDHVFVVGWDAEKSLVNGNNTPPPLVLAAGVSHRFRLIGIGAASGGRFSLKQDSTLVSWRAVARDGADLPAKQAVVKRARYYVGVGETADFEWTPVAGEYTLTADLFGPPFMTRKVIVR